MPSPFPGMDPYLEGSMWTTLHAHFAVEIARRLTLKLQPRYVALANQRFVEIDHHNGVPANPVDRYPDVGVVENALVGTPAGVAGTLQAPLQIATVIPDAVTQFFVEVRDAQRRRLITDIELLSPVNKRGKGRRKYLRRRESLLDSDVHLVELDLLRRGQRVPTQQPLPSADYFVFVNRTSKWPLMDVWPIRVLDPLPTVPVPLGKKDADVWLELQAALDAVYQDSRYDLLVDYNVPPEVPLSPPDAAWADELLRAKGLRK